MTSSGNSARPMWRRAAFTECTRSTRESIRVPSRSKMTSLIECASRLRRVRIIAILRINHESTPLAALSMQGPANDEGNQPPGPELACFPIRDSDLQCNLRARPGTTFLDRIFHSAFPREPDGDYKNRPQALRRRQRQEVPKLRGTDARATDRSLPYHVYLPADRRPGNPAQAPAENLLSNVGSRARGHRRGRRYDPE